MGAGWNEVSDRKIDANTKFEAKKDIRSGFDRFSPDNIAAKKNATPSQIALAWLLAQKPFIVSIPGTRSLDHLKENVGATHVELTPADLSELETEFSKLKIHGGRMNEMQMKVVETV